MKVAKKLFPEAAGPSIEDVLVIFKYKSFQKLTAILLAFLFVFTPLSPVFAQQITASSTESNSTPSTTPAASQPEKTENQQPSRVPNKENQIQTPPTEAVDKETSEKATVEEDSPPLQSSDYSESDPKIETGYNPAKQTRADEANGALLTEYPITVPPGRNGFQPDLKLQYNSQNSKEIDSFFGAGWSLNIPYIEKINKSGVNNFYSTGTNTPLYFSSSLSGELIASTTATTTYVSRVDNGEFLNYVFINNTYWTATDKKGNKYYFGDSDAGSPVEFASTSLYSDGNLKQYFKLENTTATVGNNLTNNGSTPFNPAQFNNGADLGSSNSSRYLNNSRDPNADSFLSGFTYNLWYKPYAAPTGGARWELGGAFSDTDKVNIRIDYYDDGGTPKVLFIYQKSGVSDTQVTYSTPLPTGSFSMLTISYNGSTIRGYVNGTEVGSVSVSGTGSGTYGASGYSVGAAIHGGNKASGVVDDVSAFNRALSGSEVTSLYPSGQATPPTLSDSQNSSRIHKWMLDKILDTNGNQIKYEYYKSGSQIYPYKIYYAGNTTSTPLYNIEFTRETRSDISTSTRTGFPVITNSRIKDINIKKDTSFVHKYTLGYTAGDNGARSLLSGVTESGIDDNGSTTTLPSTLFSYQARQGGWSSNASFTPPTSLKYAIASDVNGDGFVDIMYAAKDASGTSTRGTWLNNGQSSFTASTTYNPPIDFYGYDDDCTSPWCDLGVRMADVNGDGLEDMLESNSFSTHTYLNNGFGWTASSTWLAPSVFANGTTNVGNQRYAEIGEINGDGLPDVFKVVDDGMGSTYEVYLHNGQGWTQATGWTLPGVPKTGRINTDINGDTLTDFVRGYFDGGSSKSTHLNNSTTTWDSFSPFAPPIDLQNEWSDDGVRVFDFNGDGLPDVNQSTKDTSGNTWRATYLNTGSGWGSNLESGSYSPFSYNNIVSYVGSLIGDLDGNGLADTFYLANINGNDVYDSNVNNMKPIDVLTRITFPTGGKTEISYKPSAQYYASTTQLNTLPLIIQTVNQIVTSENGATSTAETFTYKGGGYYYAGSFDRKFSGFNEVHKTDAVGNVTKTFYHQGNTSATSTGEFSDNYFKIGRPYRVEQYNSSGNLFKKTINKWESTTTTANGIAGFVKLTQAVDFTYDGDSSHKDKAESFTYNTKGDLTQKIEYGEVTGSDDGTFSDTGTDDFTTTYTYATSSTTSAMSLLATESTLNNAGSKVKENKYYYDVLSLGRVDKGNHTKQEMWKASSTYVDIEKTYNSYGLITSEKDPRDKTTTYSYDSNNLYPATVTNPLSQVTQFTYDYSSGKVATTTDPNGNIFVSVYDGLDRVIEQKQPNPDATSTLLTALTFTYTNATSSFSVKQSSYLDTSTTTDTYIYLDGLGRKKQERKEAEGSNYSVKDYVYNNIGSLQKESLPYFSTGTASTTATSTSALFINYGYDALYRISTTTNSVGTTTNTYADWKTTITDPNGKNKSLYSDAFGNLKQVDEVNGSSTYSTLYTYDYNRNLATSTDASGNIRNFTYDGLGRRLTAQDLHASGDSTFGSYTYTYDDSGNLTQKVDPKAQTVNYTYDDINRQLTEDSTGLSGTEVTYTYDSCTQGKGRLCTASSTLVHITNVYNALGQLTQETKVITGNSYSTSYTYDRAGNQLTITSPDSSQVKYIYNSAGLIDQVQRKESTDESFTDVVSSYDYSPLEQPTVITFANGAVTTNTYNAGQMYRLQRKLTTLPPEEESMMAGPQESEAASEIFVSESLPDTEKPDKDEKTLGVPEIIIFDPPPKYIPSTTPENEFEIPTTTTDEVPPLTPIEPEGTPVPTPAPEPSPEPDPSPTPSPEPAPEPVLPIDPGGGEVFPVDPEIPAIDEIPENPTSTPTAEPTPEEPVLQSSPISSYNDQPGFFTKMYKIIAGVVASLARGATKAVYILAEQFTIKTANAAAEELYETPLFTNGNLQEYFRLENATATVGSNLTNNGSTPFNSAKFNNGADMGSSNSSKWLNNTNDPNGYSFLSGFTLNFWYKPPAAPTSGARWELAGAFSDTDKVNMRVDYYDDSGTPKLLYIYQKSGVSDNQVSYSTTVPTSYFSMLTLTYTGTSTRAYINGTYLGTVSVTGGGTGSYGVSGAAVGAAVHGGNKADGIVDDMSIFNRVLTDDEISDLYTGDWPILPEPGFAVQDITYTYDNNGNITQLRESASTTLERVVTYGYDDLNRLTNASTTAASTTPYSYSYTYDPLGNMLTRVENGTTTSYTYATNTSAYLNPHAVATTTAGSAYAYTYDNNGNLLTARIGSSTPTSSYTWDYDNRMTQAVGNSATTTYGYDPFGQRAKMTVATTSSATTYYPSKFYNVTGSTPTKHIFLPNGTLIATIIGNPESMYMGGSSSPMPLFSGFSSEAAQTDRPEVNLNRWNGEVSINVSYDLGETTSPPATRNGERVEWKGEKQELHAYPLPATGPMEQGGFEIEVYLKEKPLTNLFEFPITGAENLDFFYQAPLNEEKQEKGVSCTPTQCVDTEGKTVVERPENVVGSYAVYHKQKKGHILGETNYGTGKAFHIYRPKAIDAAGKETWGELSYAGGTLTVKIPQTFLDQASYPVLVDPTFGYTSIGGSEGYSQDPIGTVFTPSEAGTISAITSYHTWFGTNYTVANAVYSDSSTNPDTKLAEDSGNSTVSVTGWKTTNLSYAFTAVPLWLYQWNSSNQGDQFYDTGTTNQSNVDTATFETWPNPMPGNYPMDRKYTIYATYDQTATSSSTSTIQYIHTDHLGGTNVVTNESGEAVTQLVDAYPYGTFRIDQQNGFNEQRKGISGHEYDSNSGLTYANARYYNGSNGKFTSQDPAFINLTHLKVQLADPQSWNSYAYARNNPIVLVDQYGNMWTPWQSSGGFVPWMGNGGFLYNVYGNNVNSITTTAQNIQQNGWTADNIMALGADVASITAKTSGVIVGSVGVGMTGGAAVNTLSPTAVTTGATACASGGCQKIADNAPKVANGLQLGQKIQGVGTVIENAAGKISGFNHNGTYHGLDQIISRGVKPEVLLNTVQNPLQRFAQTGDRTLYLSQQAGVVLDKAGQVVTSFTSNQFYPKYTNLINQITGGQ